MQDDLLVLAAMTFVEGEDHLCEDLPDEILADVLRLLA